MKKKYYGGDWRYKLNRQYSRYEDKKLRSIWSKQFDIFQAFFMMVSHYDVIEEVIEKVADMGGEDMVCQTFLGLYPLVTELKEEFPEEFLVLGELLKIATEHNDEWDRLKSLVSLDRVKSGYASARFIRSLLEELPQEIRDALEELFGMQMELFDMMQNAQSSSQNNGGQDQTGDSQDQSQQGGQFGEPCQQCGGSQNGNEQGDGQQQGEDGQSQSGSNGGQCQCESQNGGQNSGQSGSNGQNQPGANDGQCQCESQNDGGQEPGQKDGASQCQCGAQSGDGQETEQQEGDQKNGGSGADQERQTGQDQCDPAEGQEHVNESSSSSQNSGQGSGNGKSAQSEVEAFKEKLKERSKEIVEMLNNMRDEIVWASYEALNNTSDTVGKAMKAAETLGGWSTNPAGGLSPDNLAEIHKLAEFLENDDMFAEIMEMLGRLEKLQSDMEAESPMGYDEFSEFVPGPFDLATLAPTEFLGLASPARSPMGFDFTKRMFEGQLLNAQYKGKSEVGLGPVIVLIDTSGSMSGRPGTIAKALAVLTLLKCLKDDRPFMVIMYSGPGDTVVWEPDSRPSVDEVYTNMVINMRFSGGTEPYGPLTRALLRIVQDAELHFGPSPAWSDTEKFGWADIIHLTDGYFGTPPPDFTQLLADARSSAGLRMFTIQIGVNNAELEEISEEGELINITQLQSFNEGDMRDILGTIN